MGIPQKITKISLLFLFLPHDLPTTFGRIVDSPCACPFFSVACVFLLRFAALIADAESAMTASADRLVELDTMIAEAQANRTDEHTTIAEILERHPDIAAEIEEEIKEDKWFAQ